MSVLSLLVLLLLVLLLLVVNLLSLLLCLLRLLFLVLDTVSGQLWRLWCCWLNESSVNIMFEVQFGFGQSLALVLENSGLSCSEVVCCDTEVLSDAGGLLLCLEPLVRKCSHPFWI